MEDKSILCMEHCPGEKMFGFAVPPNCPSCGNDLKQSDLRIPPFRLPSPFRNAQASPCAIILKPTRGNFLSDYKNSDDLHIGITSSEGVVYEYDSGGLHIGKIFDWTHCITIENFTKAVKQETWAHYWDFTLQVIAGQSVWRRELYDQQKHNCYNFVLSFLRALQIPEFSGTKDPATFCRNFIIPKTASAAKYITLYRKLICEVPNADKCETVTNTESSDSTSAAATSDVSEN